MLLVKTEKISEGFEPDGLPKSALDYVSCARGLARKERAAGMALLCKILEEIGITDWSLGVSENGKPFLTDSQICFSISHAGGLCAVAVSDAPVGVDLQDLDAVARIKDPAAFVQRFFTDDEQEAFLKSPTHESLCELWTKKEALVKLLGFKLGNSLSSLSTLKYPNVSFNTSELLLDKKYILTVAEARK